MKSFGQQVARYRLFSLALVVACLALGLTACGGGGDSSSENAAESTAASTGSSDDAESTTSNTNAASTTESSGESKKIGIVSYSLETESELRVVKAAQKAAEEKGWTTQVINAKLDMTKAIAAFQTFINQNVSGIVASSGDNTVVKPYIKQAEAAGIPVITYDGGQWVPGLALEVFSPATGAAAEVAQYVFEVVSKEYGTKPVDIIMMTLDEATPCRHRAAGFEAVAKFYPNVHVEKYAIDGENALAAANSYVATQLNAKGDSLVGVLSCWDLPAEGAAAAAKAAGRTSGFTVAGMNGEAAAIDLIRAHDPIYKATAAEPLSIGGYETIQWMEKVFNESAEIPPTGSVALTGQLITASNVPQGDQYELTRPQGWKEGYWKE